MNKEDLSIYAFPLMILVIVIIVLAGLFIRLEKPRDDIDIRSHVSTVHREIREAQAGMPNGSAFYIGNGYFVTNAHVTRGKDMIYSSDINGNYFFGEILYEESNLDISIFRVYHSLEQFEPVAMACRNPEYGEDIRLVGHPARQRFFTAFGRVAGDGFYNDETNKNNVYPVNASVVPGMSGGPVFDADGYVIGQMYVAVASPVVTDRYGPRLRAMSIVNFGIITSSVELCQYFDKIGIEYEVR